MPFPKLSAVLNNCPLHALTPEIKEELLKFREHADYDNKHNADYLLLKDKFAAFYGFNPAEFSWKQFADVLGSYNAFDTQIIMGPVLRLFMKDKMISNDFIAIIAQANEVSPEELIKNYTDLNPKTARYESLAPDELFTDVGQYLGLSLQYTPQDGPSRLIVAQDPVAQVNIFHNGGAEGAQTGGHWERTAKGEGSVDCQNRDDTQLNHFLPLLGQDSAVNPYGFDLLKKHVQLTARSLKEKKNLYKEFAELITTANQISQYLFNIVSVPRELAIKLLGSDLTADAALFISEYKFEEIHPNQIYEQWIKADASQKPKLGEYEQLIMNRLLMPVIAASSDANTPENKSGLTQAQTDFISREHKDSRLFETWYDNEDVLRLVWAMHQDLPESQRNQFMDPYVFFDTYNRHDIDEEIALCVRQLVEAPDRRYYPFIIKPEIGSAHYYAGIIRKDIVKGEPRLTTFLFNPTGSPEQVVKKLKLPSHVLIGGESLVLSPHEVQTRDKDNGRLVSCGPLCVEFIGYALQNPGWIDSLDERFVLPPKLQQIKDSNLEEYQAHITALREQHYQALAKVPDGQLSTILDDHLTFSTFISDELKAKARRRQIIDLKDDPFDEVDPADYEEDGEDIFSFSSDGENDPPPEPSDDEVDEPQVVTDVLPQTDILLAEQEEQALEEAEHATRSSSDEENVPVLPAEPSDDGIDEQQGVIDVLPQTDILQAEQEEQALEEAEHVAHSSSDEENAPVLLEPSDDGVDEPQTDVDVLPQTDVLLAEPNEEVVEEVEHVASSSSDVEDNSTPREPSNLTATEEKKHDDGHEGLDNLPGPAAINHPATSTLTEVIETELLAEEEQPTAFADNVVTPPVLAESDKESSEEEQPNALSDNVDAQPVLAESDEESSEEEQPAALVDNVVTQPVLAESDKESSEEEQPVAFAEEKPFVAERAKPALLQAEQNFEKQFKFGALDKKIANLLARLSEAKLNNDTAQYHNLREAYFAAKNLRRDLTAAGVVYFNNPTKEQYREFKTSCDGYLKTAHKTLDKHRGWSEFLVNLAIGIFTAGLGLLIKGGINLANNHSFFHVHKTASAKLLDDIEESVKDASKITPSA
ncbi:hypothetical protein [Legionella shakespearei]|uniref:Effector protein B, substrate of the Dot/Icm secretion system n=1 Tax=Legionella shakespearei DSM 23087 TaxID=1122169 RepID=A0A0W0YKT8_9GAMM|nr:hypothetical protein [Legionella shakespearei]KTD57219.1 effector protein B, substrate of the Dot/Icm secretion system [Legionella shakespearei DSM 23087]